MKSLLLSGIAAGNAQLGEHGLDGRITLEPVAA